MQYYLKYGLLLVYLIYHILNKLPLFIDYTYAGSHCWYSLLVLIDVSTHRYVVSIVTPSAMCYTGIHYVMMVCDTIMCVFPPSKNLKIFTHRNQGHND